MTSFAPAVGPDTTILPLLNGLRHLDILDARFGPHRVLGGICLIAATLNERRESFTSMTSTRYRLENWTAACPIA